MKICWDNLERLRYSKKAGKWYNDKTGTVYVYCDSCKICSEPFLAPKHGKMIYCSSECKCKDPDMYSEKMRKAVIKANKGRKHTEEWKIEASKRMSGKGNPNFGKKKTEEEKKALSVCQLGDRSSVWKGGYRDKNLAYYDTYAPQLEWCEEVRRNKEDPNVLEVRCFKCGEWFVPSFNVVKNRAQFLKGNRSSEQNFYCSDVCKRACPIYHKTPESLIKVDMILSGNISIEEHDRTLEKELRQLVLERDGNKCTKCGSLDNLHCHHILPVAVEPLLSADIDNCTTLCEQCHNKAHKQDGCRYGQLGNLQ
jgi:5-methylcytosine-specific restriction endonuclease McrA